MEIHELKRVMLERWRVVAIITLLFIVGTLVWYSFRPAEYEAQGRIIVSTSSSMGTAVDAYAGERVAQLRTSSYVELLNGQEVAGRAAQKLDYAFDGGEIEAAVSTRIAPDQPLITVTATAATPAEAVRILEAVQQSFQEFIAEIERPGTDGSLTSVQISSDPPAVSRTGQPVRDTIIAGFVGLAIGVLLAVVRDRNDRKLRYPGQLSACGLTYLGTASGSGNGNTEILSMFGRIAMECVIRSGGQPANRLMVAGVDTESTSVRVARGLADALASYGKKVVFIDAASPNARPDQPGLSNYFAGEAEWSDCVTPGRIPNLLVMDSGRYGDRLDSFFVAEVDARPSIPLQPDEYVVIAAPSIVHSPVAVALTSVADAGVLVATRKQSRIDDITEARFTLEAMCLPTLGLVLEPQSPRPLTSRAREQHSDEPVPPEVATAPHTV